MKNWLVELIKSCTEEEIAALNRQLDNTQNEELMEESSEGEDD